MKKYQFDIINFRLSFIYPIIFTFFCGCIEDEKMSKEVMNVGLPVFGKGATLISRTASTIEVSAEVEKENGAEITQRGICYGTSPEPTLATGFYIRDTTNGRLVAYTLKIEKLNGNTPYYIRPYATNAKGTSYGYPDLCIETLNGLGVVQTVTPTVSAIRATMAQVSGKIVDKGEGEVISYGVYFSQRNDFAAKDSIVGQNEVDGNYTCQLSGLTPATTYYVMAFLINTYGTVVGNIDSLITLDGLPDVSDVTVKNRGFTDVTLTATVTNGDDETTNIVERGFCWAIDASNHIPTIENDTVHCDIGVGAFERTITGLVAQQKYVARAYAKSPFGIKYSNNVTPFSTKTDIPTIQTEDPTTPANGNVIVGGTVYDMGISVVDSAGICWSSSNTTPTLTDNIIKMSMNGGHFSGMIARLKGGTTYYIRAFASNSNGTSYGDVKSVTAPPIFSFPSGTFSGIRFENSTAYFSIGNELYLLGGDTGPNYTNELWGYSSTSHRWQQYLSFKGSAAKWQTAITYGNGAFVYGGLDENGNSKGDLYYYNALTNMWEEKTGRDSSYMSAGYMYSSSIFFVGGKNDTIRNDVWSFQIPNSVWQKKADFPEKQYGGIALVINSRAYVGLGKDTLDACNGKLWMTDDGAETWTQKTTCNIYNKGIWGGVACNEHIYVIDEAYFLLEYNPITDVWTRKSQLPVGNRKLHCIYEVGSQIYIGLGLSNTFVIYNPVWDN